MTEDPEVGMRPLEECSETVTSERRGMRGAFAGQSFSLFCPTVPDMICEKEEIIAEIEYCQS